MFLCGAAASAAVAAIKEIYCANIHSAERFKLIHIILKFICLPFSKTA